MSSKTSSIKKNKVDDNPFLDPELITDVVHKIKNGLGGIAGFTGLLERDITIDDPKYRVVQRIYHGVLSVNDIVVALMNLSIKLELSVENVQLTALVKEIWANELQEVNRSLNEKVKTIISGNKCQVQADRFVLQKIISSAFKIINFTNNRIVKIDVSSLKRRALLAINFEKKEKHEKSYFDKANTIYEVMKNCEPVEPRLNCAVLIRMVSIHGGEVEINRNKDATFTLRILLDER